MRQNIFRLLEASSTRESASLATESQRRRMSPRLSRQSSKKYDDAIEEHLLAERSARGYTVREPSLYLNSSNERWASDARDWVAHVDAVMAYGLEVQNQFAETGEAPDLEEFKTGIPKIEWSIE